MKGSQQGIQVEVNGSRTGKVETVGKESVWRLDELGEAHKNAIGKGQRRTSNRERVKESNRGDCPTESQNAK
jgi:hypothetical protein